MDLTTAAASSPATGAMPLPRPLKVALKHRVYPSAVHVQMRREERTAGGASCSLRLRCSLTTSSEKQLIGAPAVEVEEEGEPEDFGSSLDGVDLRSHDACHDAVHKLLSAIRVPGPVSLLDPAAGEWYEPVLRAAADDIVSQLQQVTNGEQMRGHAFDVSLSIEETFRFVQPEALLLACEEAAIPASSRTPDERCAVCMECLPLPATPDARPAVCMEEKAAFALPSCGHTFHRGCIAAWFHKGSTCPLCRCDMMYCLFEVEKQFGLHKNNNENDMEAEDGTG